MRNPAQPAVTSIARHRLRIDGLVQGVGFRPFVYRLARELDLTGFVLNDSSGVLIEVEGQHESLKQFRIRLSAEAPRQANIVSIDTTSVTSAGETLFEIRESLSQDHPNTLISPDIATCDDCLTELFDPADRRYRYPFLNCTNCGPRFTIVRCVPYDRPNTSMASFTMCPECECEYHTPGDRRFHAQPNACPVCGPALTLRDRTARITVDDPIAEAVALLRAGKIIALRGIGGFHLVVDAQNDSAVRELRRRKGRAEKPFALMAPSLDAITGICEVSPAESALLSDPRRPILLLQKKKSNTIADSVAPSNRFFGVMLPYTPLHHLLLRDNFDALVMTSGNHSEEPIICDNDDALKHLSTIAYYFLLHDREILQRCDDSILRILDGAARPIRRARGFVPEPVFLKVPLKHRILAVGGQMKNCVALGHANKVFLSQHIGDLDDPSALTFFEQCIQHLQSALGVTPNLIACDLHPGYLSSTWAHSRTDVPVISVQHHHAHLVSVMADNGVTDRTIGIILDGTGYGSDGTIWGGELLIGDAQGFERFAWLAPVAMPGATRAIEQPWRMAVSYLHYAYGESFLDLDLPFLRRRTRDDLLLLTRMITRRINSPLTSSCGRLFDGFSALLNLRHEVTYEAQAAVDLEMAAASCYVSESLAVDSVPSPASGALEIKPLVTRAVEHILRGMSIPQLALQFHQDLGELFVGAACNARAVSGVETVALSGGVYQNALFFSYLKRRLEHERFRVLTHTQLPTNDGGLALGQVLIADHRHSTSKG